MIILDASTVLALLLDEPGADVVEDAIDGGAIISAVNLAEVVTKMVDAGADPGLATELVLGLFVTVESYGLQDAADCARIRAAVPRAGLSLGDRACLSLARRLDLSVITADQTWLSVADDVAVEVRTLP